LSFDLTRALRRWKPERIRAIPSRPDLTFVTDSPVVGPPLLLDSCVITDVLKAKTPPEVDLLLDRRILNHSTIVLAELTHLFGRLDPTDRRTAATLATIAATINDIPAHRLAGPSAQAHGDAGILSGLAARLFKGGQVGTNRLLNDALIFLQAQEEGAIVLTRNTKDFGDFLALMPEGRVLFYDV
jgi:predicted nucleic acid-binding protein